jgi:hypothetical protein
VLAATWLLFALMTGGWMHQGMKDTNLVNISYYPPPLSRVDAIKAFSIQLGRFHKIWNLHDIRQPVGNRKNLSWYCGITAFSDGKRKAVVIHLIWPNISRSQTAFAEFATVPFGNEFQNGKHGWCIATRCCFYSGNVFWWISLGHNFHKVSSIRPSALSFFKEWNVLVSNTKMKTVAASIKCSIRNG